VKDLEVRLDALDPDAGAAVRVIGYFDRLTEAGVGLEAIVRGAAVLAGCPARLTGEARRLSLRVEPDGSQGGPGAPPDPSWLNANVGPAGDGTGGAVLWLERPGPAGPVEAMVLERAAAAARVVLVRTRGRAPARPGDDAAAAEVLVDAAAPWMLATLHAVATSASLRGAAAALLVHHSTLQERIEHAERLLGWTIRKPDGRQRLYLALVLRRLRRHPPSP
jgi:hypothetical protein